MIEKLVENKNKLEYDSRCICGIKKEIKHFCNLEDFRGGEIRIPIEESLKQSMIQMNKIRKGDLPKKTWDEAKQELKEYDELVQYFVVNSELNMSTGKIAAQVAHVATDIANSITTEICTEFDSDSMIYRIHSDEEATKWVRWHRNGQTKIILKAKQKELEKLIEQGWNYIRDNGRTEIPEDSLTVVGCTPEWKSVMKPTVKRFRLL